jgi:tetratricopeptide (TPR) repeat protein
MPSLRQNPAFAIVERELAAGLELVRQRRRSESLAHFEKAVRHLGKWPELAAEVARQLIQVCDRAPRDPVYRHLLGAAYFFGRDFRSAEAELRKASALAPANAAILCMLGDTLMRLGQTDAALTSYRDAVAANPKGQEARTRLAGLLAYRGEKGEAREIYQGLINDGARDPLVYAGLIESSNYAGIDTDPMEYSAAIALAEDPSLPPAMRRMLYFSAAKIDRARKRRDLEFSHYVRGKDHYSYRFDLSYFSELTAALKDAVTPEFYAERSNFADPTTRPIFIFGMPRSGTTLTEQILGAHPSVAAGGELTFFRESIFRLGLAAQPSERSLPLERITERIRSIGRAEARDIASKYKNELQSKGAGKVRVTDKMPENFLHLWLITLLFPKSTYIHCTRNPIATCFSCFTTDLTDAHAYTRDLETLGAYYRGYNDLMRHWAKVLPVSIVENSYEDLVRSPESSVRRLVDAVHLAWDPACLAFHQSERIARTASYAAVREPIHPRSLDTWRDYEEYLGPLKVALGTEDAGPEKPAA